MPRNTLAKNDVKKEYEELMEKGKKMVNEGLKLKRKAQKLLAEYYGFASPNKDERNED